METHTLSFDNLYDEPEFRETYASLLRQNDSFSLSELEVFYIYEDND